MNKGRTDEARTPVMKNFCIVFNEVSYEKLESGSRFENNRLARQRANVIGNLALRNCGQDLHWHDGNDFWGFHNLVYPVNPVYF